MSLNWNLINWIENVTKINVYKQTIKKIYLATNLLSCTNKCKNNLILLQYN